MENHNEMEIIAFKSDKIIKYFASFSVFFSVTLILGILISIFNKFDISFIFLTILYASLPIYFTIKWYIAFKKPDALIWTDNKNLYFWYRGKYNQIEIKRISKIDVEFHIISGRRGTVTSVEADGILILWENNVRYKIDCIKNVGQVKLDIDHERNKPKKKTTQG